MQALRPAPREVVRGWEPLRPPMRGGAAPLQEQVVRLGSSLLPMGGPTRPTPGVPFVSRRKEPKACRGCAPGPPLGGIIIPPERVCATDPGRFATLSLGANRSFFLPRFLRGHTFCFQAVARQVGELRVRVASALDRGQGLPIFLSLIQGKTAGYPVGSAGRT